MEKEPTEKPLTDEEIGPSYAAARQRARSPESPVNRHQSGTQARLWKVGDRVRFVDQSCSAGAYHVVKGVLAGGMVQLEGFRVSFEPRLLEPAWQLGDRVRFAHASPLSKVHVISGVGPDGRVELERLPQKFFSREFVSADPLPFENMERFSSETAPVPAPDSIVPDEVCRKCGEPFSLHSLGLEFSGDTPRGLGLTCPAPALSLPPIELQPKEPKGDGQISEDFLASCAILNPLELRDGGYLQEVNRVFFHPLGLALCVKREGGTIAVLDRRSDLEGIIFDDSADMREKADLVDAQRQLRRVPRMEKLGYFVQPVMPMPQPAKNADSLNPMVQLGKACEGIAEAGREFAEATRSPVPPAIKPDDSVCFICEARRAIHGVKVCGTCFGESTEEDMRPGLVEKPLPGDTLCGWCGMARATHVGTDLVCVNELHKFCKAGDCLICHLPWTRHFFRQDDAGNAWDLAGQSRGFWDVCPVHPAPLSPHRPLTLDAALETAARDLPIGYSIAVMVKNGLSYVSAHDSGGEVLRFESGRTLAEQIIEAIRASRLLAGPRQP